MADTVQIRAGAKSGLPDLTDRELGWTRDEEELHIGTPTGNKMVTGKVWEAVAALQETLTAQQETLNGKLTATPAAAQAALADTADLAAVIGAVNGLLAAMKTSGLMESEVT